MAFPLIKSKKEFDLIYKKGKFYGGNFFSLRVLKNKSENPSLFGIVISNKVSKKAVERNKKRRQTKEILFKNQDSFLNGFLTLIIFNEGCLGADYSSLEKELMTVMKKAGMIK